MSSIEQKEIVILVTDTHKNTNYVSSEEINSSLQCVQGESGIFLEYAIFKKIPIFT